MPISHDCRQSHGDQWLLLDHPLQIADKKKEFLNQKDDLTSLRKCLALQGQDYSDISLFESWEIIWTKVSNGDLGILGKLVKQ